MGEHVTVLLHSWSCDVKAQGKNEICKTLNCLYFSTKLKCFLNGVENNHRSSKIYKMFENTPSNSYPHRISFNNWSWLYLILYGFPIICFLVLLSFLMVVNKYYINNKLKRYRCIVKLSSIVSILVREFSKLTGPRRGHLSKSQTKEMGIIY